MATNPDNSDSVRFERILKIIAKCRQRLAAGKEFPDEAIVAESPDLMPELGQELKKLRMIEAARRTAAETKDPAQPQEDKSPRPQPVDPTPAQDVSKRQLARPPKRAGDIASSDAASHETSPGPADPPQVGKVHSLASAEPPEPKGHIHYFGDYELQEELGRGGMGVVYKALQLSLGRTVAVKMILAGNLASELDVKRFYAEAEAAASLEHPNIVPIYEIGEHEGNYYFSMAYVQGRSLGQMIREKPLASRQAAEYVKTLADAMAYAHAKGVLHRDIKPANVLVDENGQPRLTDFGLAKRVGSGEDLTVTGQVLGTPQFMPPEQAAGDQEAVGPHSDLYSLGALLYALLTSRPPFQTESVTTTLLQVSDREPIAPRVLNPSIDRDLETTTLKCLEKAPSHRYASCEDLSAELARYLNGEPIQARPISMPAKAWRWCKRKPALAGLFAAAGLLVLILTIGGPVVAYMQADLRRKADDARHVAERNAELATRRGQELNEARLDAEARQYELLLRNAGLAMEENRPDDVVRELVAAPESQIGWETHLLRRMALDRPHIQLRLGEHFWGILDGVLSHDGRHYVSAGADGLLLVWDAGTGRLVRNLCEGRGPRDAPRYSSLAARYAHFLQGWTDETPWPPPARCFADLCWLGSENRIAGASLDGRGQIVDILTGESRTLLEGNDSLCAVAANADGSQILFGSLSRRLILVASDGDSREIGESRLETTACAIVRWEEANRWIVGCEDGQIIALDGTTLEPLGRSSVDGAVWSLDVLEGDPPNPPRLAAGCDAPDRHLNLFDLSASGEPVLSLVEATKLPAQGPSVTAVHSVRFDDSGRIVHAIDNLGRLVQWDCTTRQLQAAVQMIMPPKETAVLKRDAEKRGWPFPRALERTGVVSAVEGNRICTASLANTALVWKHEPNTVRKSITSEGSQRSEPRIVFDDTTPNVLWVLSEEGELETIHVSDGRRLHSVQIGQGCRAIARLPGTRMVATAGDDGHVRSWTYDDMQGIVPGSFSAKQERPLLSLAASHHGKWLAAVDDQALLVVWDIESEREISRNRISPQVRNPLTGKIAFSRDDSLVAAFGAGVACGVYSTKTQPFEPLQVQPDVAGAGGTALMWDSTTPDLLFCADDVPRFSGCCIGEGVNVSNDFGLSGLRYPENYPEATCVKIEDSPNGNRRFFLYETGIVLIYEPIRLGELYRVDSGPDPACDMAMDSNGRHLAIAHKNGVVDVWDASYDRPTCATSDRRYTGRWLVEPSPDFIGTDLPGVAFDDGGRLSIAAIDSIGKRRRLVLLKETQNGLHKEVVQDTDVESPDALGLAFAGRDDAIIAYRCLTPIGQRSNKYSGNLRIAQRNSDGKWRTTDLAVDGNFGFWPILLLHNGQVQDVFHFTYAGYRWLRTKKEGSDWLTEPLGRQGDGTRALSITDRAGNLHAAFGPMRLLCDPGPAIYVRWDGKELVREVIAPSAQRVLGIAVAEDDEPIVLAARTTPHGCQVLLKSRRGELNWDTAIVPANELVRGGFACDEKGKMYILARDGENDTLVLLEKSEEGWSQAPLADTPPATPRWAKIHVDGHGDPVVVAGYQYGKTELRNGIRVFRQVR